MNRTIVQMRLMKNKKLFKNQIHHQKNKYSKNLSSAYKNVKLERHWIIMMIFLKAINFMKAILDQLFNALK